MKDPTPASVRADGSWIASVSRDVAIDRDAIDRLASEYQPQPTNGTLYTDVDLHPSTGDEGGVQWVFLIDVLNFAFWGEGDALWSVSWRGRKYTGYMALCAAIRRAMDDGFPMTSAEFWSRITQEDLAHIFRSSDCPISLLSQRVEVLHEAGSQLLSKWNGQFGNVVRASNQSASQLVDTVVSDFKSFRDEAYHMGRHLWILKRAQILVADLWSCCQGTGLGKFDDIDSLTAFADYRVPQGLANLGILKYSSDLMHRLATDPYLAPGSRQEIEIRGCTVHAIELLCAVIRQQGKDVRAAEVDYWIWSKAKAETSPRVPIHKTLSIYY